MGIDIKVPLKPGNFASDFFYKPFSSKLSRTDKAIAFIATVALAIFSLGIAHLVLGLIRIGTKKVSNASEETKKSDTENAPPKNEAFENVTGTKNQYEVGPPSACSCHAVQAACTLLDTEFKNINGNLIDQILERGAKLFDRCGFKAGENYAISSVRDAGGIPESHRLLGGEEIPSRFEEGFAIIEGAISCSPTKTNLLRAFDCAQSRMLVTNQPVALLITEGFTTTTVVLSPNDAILHFDSHGKESSGNKALVSLYSSTDDFASELLKFSGHAPQFDICMVEKK